MDAISSRGPGCLVGRHKTCFSHGEGGLICIRLVWFSVSKGSFMKMVCYYVEVSPHMMGSLGCQEINLLEVSQHTIRSSIAKNS